MAFRVTDGGYGGHRSDKSTSGAAILAAFIPTFLISLVYLATFAAIRNYHRKFYAPRTFLGTIPEKHRTPSTKSTGVHWIHDLRQLSDDFVLQHNSLDAYLYLRFLKFIIGICLLGCLLAWPVLIPVNATGGGTASQLDKISFSNISKNDRLWAHTVIAVVFFSAVMFLVTRERLRLIGIRQAYLLDEPYASRLSARTVLFMNAPREACQPDNMKRYFGEAAERSWPVKDTGDLASLIEKRNQSAFDLESAQMDLSLKATKSRKHGNYSSTGREDGQVAPKSQRPTQRHPPLVGTKVDSIDRSRLMVVDLNKKIESHRAAPSRNIPEQGAVFVAFSDQAAAHRAFQRVTFHPHMPLKDRFLAPQPKEVLWENIAMPSAMRMSKASFALAFVIVFTIFFSIPIGILGTISNVKYLADNVKWLEWIDDLPSWVVGLLSGLAPPSLTSWFVSYVPKLFRHIAKLSGEPTNAQAELKTQAWYFVFQVFQVFLVTTFSSGAASVTTQIMQHPDQTPRLLAEALPKASNFYLTYFIIQGTTSAASNILNYSDLLELLFYEKFWDKTPRDHFMTYSQMKGTPWASWYPKFANFLVIAIVYACIAPLVLGFAAIGVFVYYLSYRYSLLYVRQTKTDTRGESYKRALQQIPTGIYLAQLCLIGLFGLRKAGAQTAIMIVFLVVFAITNFFIDQILKPLERYLGVDIWQEQELLLAQEDGVDMDDEAARHAASHGRRLGLQRLPNPAPRVLSDLFDSTMTTARNQAKTILYGYSTLREDSSEPLSSEAIEKAYTAPALTSKAPKLWIPRDSIGVSKEESGQNEAVGISTTDDAAEIDDNGKLHWDHNFAHVPIYRVPQLI
nr:putative membrane protein c24h6.13 [Quercus suber]